MNFTKISVVILLIFTVLNFTGCFEEKIDTSLKVGSSIDLEPFEFQTDEQSDFQGFDIDLIQAVGKELGREIKISNISFDNLIPSLRSKNIDLIVSMMAITEERRQKILFSYPYYHSGVTIVIPIETTDINSHHDLKGKRVAVQKTTIAANETKKIEGIITVEFDTATECLLALQNGEVDATVNDHSLNDYTIHKNNLDGLRSISDHTFMDEYNIGMGMNDPELQKQINTALKKLYDSGEFDKIYSKWFGHNSDLIVGENQ